MGSKFNRSGAMLCARSKVQSSKWIRHKALQPDDVLIVRVFID